MRALVIEPAGIVEFVVGVLIVADVARGLRRVARTAAAHTHQARAIRRPHKAADAVLETGHTPRLTAGQRKEPHLTARDITGGLTWGRARREKRDGLSIGAPTWAG